MARPEGNRIAAIVPFRYAGGKRSAGVSPAFSSILSRARRPRYAWLEAFVPLRVIWSLLVTVLIALSSATSRAGEPHVLVITIDGFAQSLFADPAAPIPTFRR